MSMDEAVKAYLEGRMDRPEFMNALGALGVPAEVALAYAQVLQATGAPVPYATDLRASEPLAGTSAFTPEELQVLTAMAARIFPTTDTPGATEAGAANYVDQALADAYQPSLARYRRGLGELDIFCTSTLGASFAALSAAQQDAVLTDLEAGRIGAVDGGAEFFQLVRRHVLEGVFCEPQYGGNRDLVGWRVVGFPGQRYGYGDPYINRVVDLPPIAVQGPPIKGDGA